MYWTRNSLMSLFVLYIEISSLGRRSRHLKMSH